MKLIQLASIAVLALCTTTVFAGTVVKIQDSEGLATILTDGKHARMNSSDNEYVLVDYKKQTVTIVDPTAQQAVLLDAKKTSGANPASKLNTTLKAIGAGKNIAGYATKKYSFSANGKTCGVIYGSTEVYQKKGIKELVQAMNNIMEKQQAMMGGFAGMLDDCALAEMKLNDQVKTIGVPMRTEKNGVVDSEVKSIKLNVDLPADTFVVPAGYKTVTMEQKMSEAKQQMQQMQQYQPQMQQMMQQMQESGQMPPEVMEQMRRAQDMMKQYKQQ